ncbi:MAG: hypothetical protein ACXWB1_01160, partial [Kaistella sp.]
EITLNNINSSNVMDFYNQNQILKINEEIKSVDLITQIGIGNTMQVADVSAQYLHLIQDGNYNTTYFINPNNYPTNAEIKINGSGNYIDITGSNSISNGMKLTINANDMTIFMRNY